MKLAGDISSYGFFSVLEDQSVKDCWVSRDSKMISWIQTSRHPKKKKNIVSTFPTDCVILDGDEGYDWSQNSRIKKVEQNGVVLQYDCVTL